MAPYRNVSTFSRFTQIVASSCLFVSSALSVFLLIVPGTKWVRANELSQQIVHQTDESETIRAEADRLFDEARELYQQQTVVAWQQALAKFEEVRQLYQALGDRQGEVNSLEKLGNIYNFLREYQKAIESYQQSVLIFQQIGDRQGEANSLNNLGTVYKSLEEYEKAIDFFQESLRIKQQIEDRRGEANALSNLGSVYDSLGEYEKAIDFLQQSLPIDREIGNHHGEASSLRNLGNVYKKLGEHEKAIDFLQQSFRIFQEIGDRQGEATSLGNLGSVYDSLGEHEKAIDFLQQSLQIKQQIGDRQGEATSLGNLGSVYDSLGEYEKAIDSYQQSFRIFQEIGDRQGEASSLNNLGNVYGSLGGYEKAIDFHQQSLQIKQEIGDRQGEASSLNNLGNVYDFLGEYQKTIDYYQQSLLIFQEIGDRQGQASSLGNLGSIYGFIGEYEKAINFLQQSLQIKQQIGDRRGEANSLSNLGHSYRDLREYEKAFDFYQKSLLIFQEIGDRRGEAASLSNLGNSYRDLGEYEKAFDFYQQSLLILQEREDRRGEAVSLGNLGNSYRDLGEYEKAFDFYQKSLLIFQEIGNPQGEARTLLNLAVVHRRQNNLTEALESINEALGIIERLRSQISRDDLRVSYFATVQNYYQLKVELLMELHQQHPQRGYDIEALETSDRGRARGLLDLLSEANANIFKDIDPSQRQRYEALQFQIEALEKESIRLASSEATQARVLEVQAKLKALREQESQLRDEIRQKSPAYAALQFPQPLTLKEMQAQLDGNTLMLYYDLGEDRSYLWAVTRESTISYVLPHGKAVIDQAARDVIEVISDPGMYGVPVNATDAEGRTIAETTTTLSHLILDPIGDRLARHQQLVIVADGELQYVPFAALNLPGQTSDTYTPLVTNHDLVNLPSASTIAILRETLIDNRQLAPKTLAILYDPVFQLDDERFSQISPSAVASSASETDRVDPLNQAVLERVIRNFDFDNIPRLKHTRIEGEAILALVPDEVELATTDFEANYSWLDNSDLTQYRYIHLATHGFFDETNPELSGLVLSRFDALGNPQRGYLRLGDLFNLNFPAEMVVLSACQTALGENVRGEGIVGVTRGLMYAGASRVVTSLWNVDDEVTADLMEQLYRQILRESASPASALSATQRAMWQQGQSPYLWAAFTLQGEWR